MLSGHRTWVFEQKPVIISTGTVGGPFEANGAISQMILIFFMLIYGSDRIPMKKHIKSFLKKPVKRQWKKGKSKKNRFNFFLQET